MTDAVIVEGDETPPAEPDASGVAAGVALAESGHAAEDAAAAQASADAAAAEAAGAEDTAGAAYQAALAADARSLSLEEKLDTLATIQLHQAQQQAAAAQPAAKPAEAEGDGKAKDEPPKNLEKKAGKRKTLRERWEGV